MSANFVNLPSSFQPLACCSATTEIVKPATQSTDELEKQISALGHNQIDMLSRQLAEAIVKTLGKKERLDILHRIQRMSMQLSPCSLATGLTLMNAKIFTACSYGSLFTKEQRELFIVCTAAKIASMLTDCFQFARTFVDKGFSLHLTGFEPSNFLDGISKEIPIILTYEHMTQNHTILLNLDSRATEKSKKLCFTILQKSSGIVFEEIPCSIDD